MVVLFERFVVEDARAEFERFVGVGRVGVFIRVVCVVRFFRRTNGDRRRERVGGVGFGRVFGVFGSVGGRFGVFAVFGGVDFEFGRVRVGAGSDGGSVRVDADGGAGFGRGVRVGGVFRVRLLRGVGFRLQFFQFFGGERFSGVDQEVAGPPERKPPA
ncbi:MAG: hypothetical protein IJO46_11435 [Thermoguttaceae bacterium]|nr:hypothetical protein [Thermoguttaceae bacterium]